MATSCNPCPLLGTTEVLPMCPVRSVNDVPACTVTVPVALPKAVPVPVPVPENEPAPAPEPGFVFFESCITRCYQHDPTVCLRAREQRLHVANSLDHAIRKDQSRRPWQAEPGDPQLKSC